MTQRRREGGEKEEREEGKRTERKKEGGTGREGGGGRQATWRERVRGEKNKRKRVEEELGENGRKEDTSEGGE